MQAGRRTRVCRGITGVIKNTQKLSQDVRFNWIMSVHYAILGGMEELWNKYTYVCGSCDALVESTTKLSNFFQDPICSCAENSLTLLSVVDATIGNSTEKEEPIMEQTMNNLPLSDAEKYNPNALVTYKKIAGTYASPEAPEYITDKVVDIEWALHNARENNKTIANHRNKVDSLRDIILEAYSDSQDQEVLSQIADLFDIELTKEITWEATIHVSGTMQVNLDEDYDLESLLSDELSVSTYNGDIEVLEQEIANVQEGY
ncbi:hypothetical protein UFOVP1119_52 [uncultured Caudovirales phage]|uniref:Uncharacterized protein n=1 Tax=uncultured Caudovirales phage TaxID=2100421 RepID=A0A6J5R1A5_9CAUD|nr:hypothetical protein UFOVP1119_52 [uncultured Caudovirales phage]CAB4193146.1 hypothetical protein UFOVP1238_26 [uncultured Caudovirales phage]